MSDNGTQSGAGRTFAVLGSFGAIFSCCAIMVSLVMSLIGSIGVTALTGMNEHPAWVKSVMHFSLPILILSVILLILGIWRATRLTQMIVGAGILLILFNVFVKSPALAYPSLVLIVGGNIVGWVQRRKKAVHC